MNESTGFLYCFVAPVLFGLLISNVFLWIRLKLLCDRVSGIADNMSKVVNALIKHIESRVNYSIDKT